MDSVRPAQWTMGRRVTLGLERIGSRSNKANVVDLTGLVSIDEQGEDLLRAMKSDGARFIARGVDMKHILAHLGTKGRPSLRRAVAHLDRNGDCS